MASGVTVLRKKLEQSAFFEERGGRFPAAAVPVTARAQLFGVQLARFCSTALPKTPVEPRSRTKGVERNNILHLLQLPQNVQ
jgi:hypothetical protein